MFENLYVSENRNELHGDRGRVEESSVLLKFSKTPENPIHPQIPLSLWKSEHLLPFVNTSGNEWLEFWVLELPEVLLHVLYKIFSLMIELYTNTILPQSNSRIKAHPPYFVSIYIHW